MPTQQQPSVHGPIDKVPCPSCGRPNDFRILESQQLLDTGHEVFCDHCGYSMIVTGIRQVKYVVVARNPTGGRQQAHAKAAAKEAQKKKLQQKPGILNRLLGTGKR